MHVDGDALESATARIESWAVGTRARLVVTPNTDHFLRWRKSERFRDAYTQADLTVLDGAPLTLLARLEGLRVNRVTGVDLFYAAAASAARIGVPFIIIGGGADVADAAAARLRDQLPNLSTPVVLSPDPAELGSQEWLVRTAEALRSYPQKFVALCLGSPKQEQLFRDLLTVAPDLSGAFLCVGAAVDFASGTIPRAPRFMRRIGFEWLFRLAVEPRRLWRRYLVEDVQLLTYFARSAFGRIGRRRRSVPAPLQLVEAQPVAVSDGTLPRRPGTA